MNKYIKYTLTVLLTAVIVGAGTYFIVNNRATDDKDSLNTQISTLESKVTTLNSKIAKTTTDTTTATGAGTGECSGRYALNNIKNGYVANPVTGFASQKLTNGVYTSGKSTLTLVDTSLSCDTATKTEAAIVLKYNDGGTGTFYYVETLSNFADGYAATGWALLGDRISLKNVFMSNLYIVTLNYLAQGPNDTAATPTQDTTVSYKVPTTGTALIKQ